MVASSIAAGVAETVPAGGMPVAAAGLFGKFGKVVVGTNLAAGVQCVGARIVLPQPFQFVGPCGQQYHRSFAKAIAG